MVVDVLQPVGIEDRMPSIWASDSDDYIVLVREIVHNLPFPLAAVLSAYYDINISTVVLVYRHPARGPDEDIFIGAATCVYDNVSDFGQPFNSSFRLVFLGSFSGSRLHSIARAGLGRPRGASLRHATKV